MKKHVIFLMIYILVAALLIVLLWPRGRNTVSYKIVKKPVHDTIYLPSPDPVKIIRYPVPADVDTAEILRNFFSTKVYEDTVHAGEFVDIKITDSVGNNELLSHNIEILCVPEIPPSAVSARCAALGVLAGKNLLVLKCDLRIKKHHYSAGYDFINRSPIVGYSYSIASW